MIRAMPVGAEPDPRADGDRHAVEQILGRPLSQQRPPGALAAGSRVRVIQDPEWDGPWAAEFLGVIDVVGAPELVRDPHARPGELEYWVKFDEPQYDSDGDGPYRGARIWTDTCGPSMRVRPGGRSRTSCVGLRGRCALIRVTGRGAWAISGPVGLPIRAPLTELQNLCVQNLFPQHLAQLIDLGIVASLPTQLLAQRLKHRLRHQCPR